MNTTATKTLPDYFNPSHFRVGQPVMYGEFFGTVSCYYGDGMWDVRLPGGPVCVSGSDIKAVLDDDQLESDMSYTHVNPLYVEPGHESAAIEFDAVLIDALPAWAADMSEGYAWNAQIPDRADFAAEAASLAAHLLHEYHH